MNVDILISYLDSIIYRSRNLITMILDHYVIKWLHIATTFFQYVPAHYDQIIKYREKTGDNSDILSLRHCPKFNFRN